MQAEINDTEPREGLIIDRLIHHAGGGIRWVYNRNLMVALAISVGLHLTIIVAYWAAIGSDDVRHPESTWSLPPLAQLDTHYVTITMNPVTIVNPGGGGGSPDVDKPIGKAKAGDPLATPKVVPDRAKDPRQAKTFDPKVPTRVKPVRDPQQDNRPLATTDRDTAKGPSSGTGYKGQHAQGTGTTDAGGSGGTGIGRGVGVGIGDGEGLGSRGWIRRPSSRPIERLATSGVVRLRFTVMPNGEITSIVPIKKADAALTQAAIDRLRAARARPLPDDAPQVAVIAAMTFTFKAQ